MEALQNYRQLVVWQKSMSLAKTVYHCSSLLPKAEVYGLRSQLTRAAVSIPSNIAEGHARHGAKEFLRFISIARGSLAELETLTILCADLDLFSQATKESVLTDCEEIGKLLTGLVKGLKRGIEE